MNIWKPVHGVGDLLCRDCFEETCWRCEAARRKYDPDFEKPGEGEEEDDD